MGGAVSTSNDQQFSFLQQTTIGDLLKEEKREPVQKITAQTRVGEALEILHKHKPPISGAPIWIAEADATLSAAAPASETTQRDDLGVWNVRDAVRLLYDIDEGYLPSKELSEISTRWLHATVADSLAQTRMCISLRQQEDNQMIEVQTEQTLDTVVALMARTKSHRIAVMQHHQQGSSRVFSLISQSMVVHFLNRHMGQLKWERGRKTLEELRMTRTRHVIHVRPRDPVYLAFELCAKYQISSVVVVNRQGKMVNSICVANIRLLHNEDALPQLLWSCQRFLKFHALHQMCQVSPATPFKNALAKMAREQLHRVYVVDEEQQCTGIVTLADILSEVFREEFW